MSAEELVAAAAAATGPIVDGDIAGWAEQVRQAASTAVVIAADMVELLAALTDPECKTFVRRVTDVTSDKGRFLIHYDPPQEYTFRGETKSFSDIRTGWTDEPAARQLARTARASIGQRAVFFQRNEKEEGDSEAPAAGYRRLWHIEPVPSGERPARPAPAAEPARPERAVAAVPAPQPAPTPAPATNVAAPAPTLNETGPSVAGHAEPAPPPPIPQPTLADAEPPPPGPPDPRPMDPALMSDVVGLLSQDEVANDNAPLRAEVVNAFRQWWNTVERDGQAELRKANTEAKRVGGRHVASIHNPQSVGALKTVAILTRCFAEEAVAS